MRSCYVREAALSRTLFPDLVSNEHSIFFGNHQHTVNHFLGYFMPAVHPLQPNVERKEIIPVGWDVIALLHIGPPAVNAADAPIHKYPQIEEADNNYMFAAEDIPEH